MSSRAAALFQRLDSDQDGNISKDEFTSGAIDLLKRASVREHHRHVGRGQGIDKRDARWQARLERAFGRIDGNGDGSLDQGEVAAPLARAGQGHGRHQESADQPAATTSVTNVTIVAIAIRRYTSEATVAPAPAPASTAPATNVPAPAPDTATPQPAESDQEPAATA